MSWSAVLGAALLGSWLAWPSVVREPGPVRAQERFLAVDLWLDSGSQELAAWQVELVDPSDRAQVVGVEGGEPAAFQEAPYYDPAALRSGRIVLAAFHVGADLPRGRVRVARVHLLVTGPDPELRVAPVVAATLGGQTIDVRAELSR